MFAPKQFGCYRFATDADIKVCWAYEKNSGKPVLDSFPSSEGSVLEADESYIMRLEGKPGSVFSIESMASRVEADGANTILVGSGACSAFTPAETKYYGSEEPVKNGRLYDSRTGVWESWEGPFRKELEAGVSYLLCVYGDGDKANFIHISPEKKITVLDYQYYKDFIAAGGSVTAGGDGTVNIQKGKADWTLKSHVLSLFATNKRYKFQSADTFGEANLYWGPEIGVFTAADYYGLDGNSIKEKNVEDGDVVLAEYRPEIIWVQSMKIKSAKTEIEPGDEVQLTAQLSKGQEKFDFLKDPVIRWESSDPAIAEVDENTGLLTAHTEGNVTIAAYADEALREQEGLTNIVKASLSVKIAEVKKTFSKITKWGSPIKVEPSGTKYFRFQTENAGDYLFEIPKGVKIKPYTTENMSYQEFHIVEGSVLNPEDKLYACGSFPGGAKGTWEFQVWNTNPEEEVILQPVTWQELAVPVKLEKYSQIQKAKDVLPSYNYRSFTPETTGFYQVDADSGEPLWIRKQDGTPLKADRMLLAAGETCYMKFEGGKTTQFKMAKDSGYRSLPAMGKDNAYAFTCGYPYVYVADKSGTCTFFTSFWNIGNVELKVYDGENWNDGPAALMDANGNYSFSVEKGKAYSLKVEQSDGSTRSIKLGLPGYKNPNGNLSSTLKLASFTDVQPSSQISVSRMSASYTTSGNTFTAKGTIKYIHNCDKYLGAKGTRKSGYFLAFRMNVQKQNFRDGGYLSITYPDKEGKQQEQSYKYSDQASTLKDGYVDVILDLSGEWSKSRIRVSTDGASNVKTYELNLENLQKEEDGLTGAVTEPGAKESFGVKTSSPFMKEQENGEVEFLYDSVAYSLGIDLPGMETKRGNYIAMKVGIPESMQNTYAGCKYAVNPSPSKDPVVYCQIPEGASYALLVMEIKKACRLPEER